MADLFDFANWGKVCKLSFILVAAFLLFFTCLVRSVHAHEGTLTWDPVTHPDLAGYKIYSGFSSRDYFDELDVGISTSYTIRGLQEGETYYFAATAYDIYGNESDFSNEVFCTTPCDNPIPYLEAGDVNINHNWRWVTFNKPFLDPVVVAKPLSFNGSDYAVVRIRNVTRNGFEIRIQEWDYLDGWQLQETVSYMAMERGGYILKDGTRVEAHEFETNIMSGFETVKFKNTFRSIPVVIGHVSTFNGEDAITTRVRNVNSQGFELRMQEQEANSLWHVTETFSYIAWEPSSGTLEGLSFEVNKTHNIVQNHSHNILFNHNFINIPSFLADIQTFDGADTANLRWENKGPSGVDVRITEEQSADDEIWHTTEVVGYMVFSQDHSPVPYSLLCSLDDLVDGKDPPCDGESFTLSEYPNGVWVYLWPETDVDDVDFTLNGTPLRRDRYAPYELLGGAPLTTLGTHTVETEVILQGGERLTLPDVAFSLN